MFLQRFFPGLMASRYGRAVGAVWLIALVVVCVRVGLSPSRQSVYAADYAPAGWQWLHGAEVYHHREHFVYSPPVAAWFVPWSVLPDAAGAVLWRLFSAVAVLAVADAWLRGPLPALGESAARKPASWTLPTALLLFLPLAIGNVNIGQVNLVILALVLGSVLAVRRERWTLAAALLAVASFVKIYPLAVGLLLALLYPRQLSWRLALALLALFVLSFGLQRPGYVWHEYHAWIAVLGRDKRLDAGPTRAWRDFASLLRMAGVPISDWIYRLIEALAGGLLALFLLWGQRFRRWPRDLLLGGVFCLGCAWMILFGPATEAATYVMLALPLCGLLTAAWSLRTDAARDQRFFIPAARIVLTAAYALLLWAGATNSWLNGRRLHPALHELQPMGALFFVAAAVWWLARERLPGLPTGATLAHASTSDRDGGGDRRIL